MFFNNINTDGTKIDVIPTSFIFLRKNILEILTYTTKYPKRKIPTKMIQIKTIDPPTNRLKNLKKFKIFT